MVEYALLLASTSIRSFAGEAGAWASTIDWHAVGYALLALVGLWIAVRAFRRSEY
jgi:hypothetical protein